MRLRLLLLCALVLFPIKPAVPAGEQEALKRIFEASHLEESWFTKGLLQAVSLPQIQSYRDSLVSQFGAYRNAVPLGEGWQVQLERALLPAQINLDEVGRIANIWLGLPIPIGLSLEQVGQDVAALPGRSSLLVVGDGKVLVAHEASAVLAVGSAFKLAVLAKLVETIERSSLSWQEVVRLKAGHRSLPSGQLQDWPSGAPLTLYSLAALMISVSDNTATDALIDFLGVQEIEPLLPAESRPLLTTRNYFLLGGAANAEERARYLASSEADRRAILVGLVNTQPTLSDYLAGGTGPEFGWFMSAESLCELMDLLLGLDVLEINPGVVAPQGWREVGYKGGSTFGAMNMTTGLESFSGRRYCVSMTWNDPDGIDPAGFTTLYAQVLALLSKD